MIIILTALFIIGLCGIIVNIIMVLGELLKIVFKAIFILFLIILFLILLMQC